MSLEMELSLDCDSLSEVQQLKSDLKWTESNLRILSQGIRVIAREMMRKHQQNQVNAIVHETAYTEDDATHATAEETVTSDDGQSSSIRWNLSSSSQEVERDNQETNSQTAKILEQNEISDILTVEDLAPGPAADLFALQNASEMILHDIRMASAEASLAVKDTIKAQSTCRNWQKKAIIAKSELNRVMEEANTLRAQNKKLMTERKILVKEVRKVRKELADRNQETMWSQLESYVTSALNIHEHQLKSSQHPAPKTSSNENRNDCFEVDNASDPSASRTNEQLCAVAAEQNTTNEEPPQHGRPNKKKIDRTESPRHDQQLFPQTECSPQKACCVSQINSSNRSSTPRLSTFAGGMAMGFGFGSFSNKSRQRSNEQAKQKNIEEMRSNSTEKTIEQGLRNTETISENMTPTDDNPQINSANEVQSSKSVSGNRTPPSSPGISPDHVRRIRKAKEESVDFDNMEGKYVSIERNDSNASTRLESPITFLESSPDIHPAVYGENIAIYDPHILRSLALPSGNDFD